MIVGDEEHLRDITDNWWEFDVFVWSNDCLKELLNWHSQRWMFWHCWESSIVISWVYWLQPGWFSKGEGW